MSRNLIKTRPTTTAEPTSGAGGEATLVSAEAWFSAGARKPYEPVTKSMLADSTRDPALHVFERVVTGAGEISASTPWATFSSVARHAANQVISGRTGNVGGATLDTYLRPGYWLGQRVLKDIRRHSR